MARAATLAADAGLTGMEFALAIPGNVGGAVWANAARSHMPESLRALPEAARTGPDFFVGNMVPTCIDDDRSAVAKPLTPQRTHVGPQAVTEHRFGDEHQVVTGSSEASAPVEVFPGVPAQRLVETTHCLEDLATHGRFQNLVREDALGVCLRGQKASQ